MAHKDLDNLFQDFMSDLYLATDRIESLLRDTGWILLSKVIQEFVTVCPESSEVFDLYQATNEWLPDYTLRLVQLFGNSPDPEHDVILLASELTKAHDNIPVRLFQLSNFHNRIDNLRSHMTNLVNWYPDIPPSYLKYLTATFDDELPL